MCLQSYRDFYLSRLDFQFKRSPVKTLMSRSKRMFVVGHNLLIEKDQHIKSSSKLK